MYCAEQVDGWRLVTDAVHAAGGRIHAQLWHVGRISHRSLQPGNIAPVSCCDIATTARVSPTTRMAIPTESIATRRAH